MKRIKINLTQLAKSTMKRIKTNAKKGFNNTAKRMKREAGGQGAVSVGRIFGAATPPRGASTCNLDPPCKNLEKNLLGASQPAM